MDASTISCDTPFLALFPNSSWTAGNSELRELDLFEIDAVSGAFSWGAIGFAGAAGALGGALGGAAGGAVTGMMLGGIGAGPGAVAGFVGGGIAGGVGGAITEFVIQCWS